MEKIFNWGTTVSKEELVEKINELANVVLDNTTKDNKLFTEINKASFYTKRFPDLFKLTVTNKDGKKYNPDDKNDMVFKVRIEELNIETYEKTYSEHAINQFNIKHTSNEVDNRIVNAYIISRIIINIVNDCSAKYKFFQPRECDLYNACYALVEFVLYLRLMNISPEEQFSTLIYGVDFAANDSIKIFYTLGHRFGIPLYTGKSDIFLEQLLNSYYRVQSYYKVRQDESGYYSAEKVHDNIIRFELADEYSAPSDKYFMLGDKKISLTLDISGDDFSFNTFLKEDLDYLLDNSRLQCFKFIGDVRELYRDVGGYNISSEYIDKDEHSGRRNIIRIENIFKSEGEVYDIYKDLLVSELAGYICQTTVHGLLPRTIFKFKGGPTRIMILPVLEVEFRDMIEDTLKHLV